MQQRANQEIIWSKLANDPLIKELVEVDGEEYMEEFS